MSVGVSYNKGTFIVIRCVYFCSQAEAQYHKGVNRVRSKTTVVPPLPEARPNRAEAVPDWQAERARQNYDYLLQMSGNAIE